MALDITSVSNLNDLNISIDNWMRMNYLDGLSIFFDHFGKSISSALKPSIWNTLINTLPAYVVALGSPFAYKFVENKYENKKTLNKTSEDINLLLLNLLQCVEDQISNMKILQEQKQFLEEDFKKKHINYVINERVNIDLIKSVSVKLTSDLPDISFELNKLENDLFWIKTYREQRNKNALETFSKYDFYSGRIDKEYKRIEYTLKYLIPVILVLYDYGTYKFKKKQIIRISNKHCLSTVWDYIDTNSIDEKEVFSNIEYKFRDESIKKWFFKELKFKSRIKKSIKEKR